MKLLVFRTRNNHKIIESVIGFNKVNVMYNLFKLKFSTKMFFHNETMFILTLSHTNPAPQIAPVVKMKTAPPTRGVFARFATLSAQVTSNSCGMALNTSLPFIITWPTATLRFRQQCSTFYTWFKLHILIITQAKPCEENMSCLLTK